MSNFDVAQLAHVELFTPKPEESLKFLRIIWVYKLQRVKGNQYI